VVQQEFEFYYVFVKFYWKLTMYRYFILLLLLLISSFNVAAVSKQEIDAYVDEALAQLYLHSKAAEQLAKQAKGLLIFPRVYKAGLLVGGEYGEGALKINGESVVYYNIAAGSLGLQAGVQRKSEIIMFMTEESLRNFRSSKGWVVGVDGSVAIIKLGAGGKLDSNTLKQPIIGFIFSNAGLMFNLTLEGSKITRLDL
jgi:lipid-binding SYLF domain-containing protein